MKNKLLFFTLIVGFAFGLICDGKPDNDHKLQCKRCNSTYFVVSPKTTKFVGEGDQRKKKTASFYKCTKCGILSDEVVKLDK